MNIGGGEENLQIAHLGLLIPFQPRQLRTSVTSQSKVYFPLNSFQPISAQAFQPGPAIELPTSRWLDRAAHGSHVGQEHRRVITVLQPAAGRTSIAAGCLYCIPGLWTAFCPMAGHPKQSLVSLLDLQELDAGVPHPLHMQMRMHINIYIYIFLYSHGTA